MFEVIILIAAGIAAAIIMEKSLRRIEKRERREAAVRRVMAVFDTRCQCEHILEDPLLGTGLGKKE